MAMATITSDSGTNIPGNLSFENSKTLRDASFSSYLERAEETFVIQLENSNRKLHSFSSISQDQHLNMRLKRMEHGEIDVFSAEKYFNDGVDEGTKKVVQSSAVKLRKNEDDPLEIGSLKQKIRPGTPSIRSELSWNSRNALLQTPRNQQPRKANNTRSRSFLASLGCNCSCNDKDSVNVDNRSSEGKEKEVLKNGYWSHSKKGYSSTLLKEDRQCKRTEESRCVMSKHDEIGLPVFNPATGNANTMHFQEEEEDTRRRKSLEVFGSPILARGDKILTVQKEIEMLAWDAIPPREVEFEIPASTNGKCNDTGSDASSDLFEIESLSTSTNPYLARQASDGMSGCITPACYAPSEASIEWSTVTASAADFSVMSDSEELNTTTTRISLHRKVLDGKSINNKELPKRRPSILSGCKSHKAVRVAGEAYRLSEKPGPDSQRHQRFESLTPMTRFHPESKLLGFDTRNGQHRLEALSLSESQFKRTPHLLYLH